MTSASITSRGPPDTPKPTRPAVRGWVREIFELLCVTHNRRRLSMLDSFRHNARCEGDKSPTFPARFITRVGILSGRDFSMLAIRTFE